MYSQERLSVFLIAKTKTCNFSKGVAMSCLSKSCYFSKGVAMSRLNIVELCVQKRRPEMGKS